MTCLISLVFKGSRRGQALVETALVFPVLFLSALVFFYVWLICRHAIALQSAAYAMAQTRASGDTGTRYAAEWASLVRDVSTRAALPWASTSETTLGREWKPAVGLDVCREKGSLAALDISQIMAAPRFMGAWLPPTLHAAADTYREPAIPEEK